MVGLIREPSFISHTFTKFNSRPSANRFSFSLFLYLSFSPSTVKDLSLSIVSYIHEYRRRKNMTSNNDFSKHGFKNPFTSFSILYFDQTINTSPSIPDCSASYPQHPIKITAWIHPKKPVQLTGISNGKSHQRLLTSPIE